MWQLVAHLTMLRQTGRSCCVGGRRLKRGIQASLRDDHIARTKQVGKCIEAELRGGDVQESCDRGQGMAVLPDNGTPNGRMGHVVHTEHLPRGTPSN
jgi:hypothetical protein